mgnify:CR=1 FL=1
MAKQLLLMRVLSIQEKANPKIRVGLHIDIQTLVCKT